jgi:hypothetical protein
VGRPKRYAAAAALALLAPLAAACSGGPGARPVDPSLTAALARVADTPGNRQQVWYDDTAALVRVAGRSWSRHGAYAALRGLGAPGLASSAPQISAGIDLIGDTYAISAGRPPAAVGLLAGGQRPAKVIRYLKALGWRRHGRGLAAPPFAAAVKGSTAEALIALPLALVAAAGTDLRYGYPAASLRQIGSPRGRTLAADPLVDALARGLGPVAAAWIGTYPAGRTAAGPAPALAAVGVRAPAAGRSVPVAVGCTAWADAAAAAAYRRALQRALLGGGLNPVTRQPFRRLLRHAAVRAAGGRHHLVCWQARTPGQGLLVFSMAGQHDLPGLS